MITIYTPTYNRAHCLPDLYDSLLRQSNKNFKWFIIDDGSIDNTEELVASWLSEAKIEIVYIKQLNEGKMAKLNFVHKLLDTELCVCIDSDDFLVDNAVELIFEKWNRVKANDKLAGLVADATDKNDKLIGTPLPEDMEQIRFCDFESCGVKGDKIFVYRVDVIQASPPYPQFEGEKFPAPGYLFRRIDEHYNLAILNRILVKKDYLEDGLSKNKYAQFQKAPNSFRFYRQERMRLATSFTERFRNAIHYVSSSLFAKKSVFKDNNFKGITLLAFPLGLLLNVYLRTTNKKGVV